MSEETELVAAASRVSLPRLSSLSRLSWGLLRAFEADLIREHALAQFPIEACGLLLLKPPGVSSFDRILLQATNIAPRPAEHFKIDPGTIETSLHARQAGYELVAIYHSHPNGHLIFSCGDSSDALSGQETPPMPWLVHLVLGIALMPHNPWCGLAGFAWHEASHSFQPVQIELMG